MAGLPNYAELTPSYGRDYRTASAAIAAFKGGEDWTYAPTRQQTSIRDTVPGEAVILRFDRDRKVTSLRITPALYRAAQNAPVVNPGVTK